MPTASIEFHNVWKKFQRGELHDSLRDLIPALAKRLVGRAPQRDKLSRGEFWAVRDVSFTVQPGEALGIIGPNGAGKSTILKLLTQILVPTRGRCLIHGRTGALIEVAAGFHPDLTGRENVYLQGAIMGMRRAEITRRFDEIVDFAEIEQFIDTPVKRYSSGMNARLGFAIAAHIDPDVLVIDEVLAVGDIRFQQKAFDRIKAMCTSGIPVAIVSHQLERIASLCTHALLLDRGRLVQMGTPTECIESYLHNEWTSEISDGGASPTTIETLTLMPRTSSPLSGDRVRFRLTGTVSGSISGPRSCSLRVRAMNTGKTLFAATTQQCGITLPEDGPFEIELELQFNVPHGVYSIETSVWDRATHRDVARGPAVTLQILEGQSFFGSVHMQPSMRLLPAHLAQAHPAS
ncbi:MAG TPA: ABC transporter ATP-binding protein [Gemmatimonadaceae bacterium]|jgi:ABC-type polysaccharide/polyol phosphate transport system, ATPase component